MKHILITTIAAVLVVGCGSSEQEHDFFAAMNFGRINEMKRLLAEGVDVDTKSKFGITPIYQAAFFGKTEVVQLLLLNGANVNIKDTRKGWTPLHCAIAEGHSKIIELLVDNGADLNANNKIGRTPLDFALQGKVKATADLLRKHGGKTGEELKVEGK